MVEQSNNIQNPLFEIGYFFNFSSCFGLFLKIQAGVESEVLPGNVVALPHVAVTNQVRVQSGIRKFHVVVKD